MILIDSVVEHSAAYRIAETPLVSVLDIDAALFSGDELWQFSEAAAELVTPMSDTQGEAVDLVDDETRCSAQVIIVPRTNVADCRPQCVRKEVRRADRSGGRGDAEILDKLLTMRSV